MLTRRFLLALGAALIALPAWSEARMGDDGLHKQDWFLDSFLELPEDLAEASSEGKFLMVLIEQAGCPYCAVLHAENFARPEIVDYLKADFVVVQLDLWGARVVVDFDGEAMEERDLAQKWGANFTPTTLIFAMKDGPAADFEEAEVFRMPGLLKPFHYMSSLEYVVSGENGKQPFQRFLQDKFKALEAQGITPDVW